MTGTHRHNRGNTMANPTEQTRPTTRPAIVFGGCLDARLIGDAHAKTHGDGHNRCKGHTVSPAGDYGPCACACHLNGNPPRCVNCGATASDDIEIICAPGPLAGRCTDVDGCGERLATKLANDPRYARWKETGRVAAERNAANRATRTLGDDDNTVRRPRGPAHPRVGRCEHCGEPTKGGKFVVGHDAKLKGLLIREANGNPDVDWPQSDPLGACLELLLRDWPTKSVTNGNVLHQALALLDDTNDAWYQTRIAERAGEL